MNAHRLSHGSLVAALLGTCFALVGAASADLLYDDSPGAHQDITLSEDLSPASITFDNSLYRYILRATADGTITSGTLLKNGSAAVTLIEYNQNPFTFGNVTVNAGMLYYRVDNTGTSNGFLASFGAGSITVNDGGTFKTNLTAGGDSRWYVLSNAIHANGNATLNVDRGDGGTSSGGNSPNYSVHFGGPLHLAGNLTVAAGSGGGSAGGTSHGIAGNIIVDQSADHGGARSIVRTGSGNQDFRVLGNMVDGAGSESNALHLVHNNSNNFFVTGDNTGFTKGLVLAGSGMIRFGSAASLGGGGASSVTVPAGMSAGLDFLPEADDLAMLSLVAGSGVSLGVATDTDIDFSAAGLNADARLGAHGNVAYTGVLTPFGATYRLGAPGAGANFLLLNHENALTGNRSLDVAGSGVHLGAANDFTGPVTIGSGGILRVADDDALGAAPTLTLAGGQLRPALAGTTAIAVPVLVTANSTLVGDDNASVLIFDNTVTLSNNAQLTIPGGNNNQARGAYIFQGVVSGEGQIRIGRGNSGARNVLELHADNSFTGGVRIGDGGGNNQLTVRAGHDNAFGTGLIDYAGNVGERGMLLEALNGARTFANNLRLTQTHPLSFIGEHDITFTGVTEFANNDIRLVAHNHTTLGDITSTGTRDLTVAGEGTLRLAGTAGYTGTTTVGATFASGGDTFTGPVTLLVDGVMPAGGTVTVLDGAALGGNGTISRHVVLQAGAGLAGGMLTVESLLLSDAFTYNWDDGDLVDVLAALDLGASNTAATQIVVGQPASGVLFTFDSIENAPLQPMLDWTIVGAPGYWAQIDGNSIVLIPEPATLGLLLLGSLGVLARRRRR